jgi:hypothetical protein
VRLSGGGRFAWSLVAPAGDHFLQYADGGKGGFYTLQHPLSTPRRGDMGRAPEGTP